MTTLTKAQRLNRAAALAQVTWLANRSKQEKAQAARQARKAERKYAIRHQGTNNRIAESQNHYRILRGGYTRQGGPTLRLRTRCRYCKRLFTFDTPAPIQRAALVGACPACHVSGRDDHPSAISKRKRAKGFHQSKFGRGC